MKSEAVITLSSSLILLLLFLSGPTQASSTHPKPVLDTQGNPVLTGSKYKIISILWGGGSGDATMGAPRNETCPLDVVRGPPLLDGLPVTLTPADGTADKGSTVHTSTSIKIEFTGTEAEKANTCPSSMEWSVGSNDAETGLRTITTGGSARFTIVESGSPTSTLTFYNLVYCGASICVGQACTRDYVCRAVGDSGRRLYAGGPAFPFYFQKV